MLEVAVMWKMENWALYRCDKNMLVHKYIFKLNYMYDKEKISAITI